MAVLGTQSLLAGRYRLRARIAAGGTGEVWRADDDVLGREVAVKVLRPEYAGHAETLARFQAEARHAGRLAHPGIVRVYDYGQDSQAGAPFLVMELVDGPSLAAVLAGGPLPPPWVLEMIAQVAAGLAAAHAAGLVHRDIKPANLLLAPGGIVKITDFGIASAAGSAPLTQSGMVACTPGYLAPERAEGTQASPAGDVYSLGIVAWEALTGAPPFTGTPLEVALAHVHRDLPPLPPAVPAGLAALVTAMTARNPADRPGSAAVVAEAGQLPARPPAPMAQAHQGRETAQSSATLMLAGIPTRDGPSPDDRRRAGKRPAVLVTLAVLAAAGGFAAIAAAATPGTTSRPPVTTPRSAIPAAGTVMVDAAALQGQPAATVLGELRQAGLRPRIARLPDGHQRPGTVIAVAPSGPVTAGATVTVTVAISPPGHRHHGKGHGDNGNGGDGGNNGGDGGGNNGGDGGGGDGH